MTERDNNHPAAGVRSVALLELTKGIIVIVAGLGLLSLIHHDLQAFAEHLVARMHLNPAKHMGRILIEAASNLNDGRLRLFALLALLYSAMRFVEGYGLWFGQRWAEWFAVVSGGVYMPLEIFELGHGFGWLKVATLIVNSVIVAYIAFVLVTGRRRGGMGCREKGVKCRGASPG